MQRIAMACSEICVVIVCLFVMVDSAFEDIQACAGNFDDVSLITINPNVEWTAWSSWSPECPPCRLPYKTPMQSRDRMCNGVGNCNKLPEGPVQYRHCPTGQEKCPKWTSWGAWTTCTVDYAANGHCSQVRTKTRECHDEQLNKVSDDQCEPDPTKTGPLTIQVCKDTPPLC